MNKEIHCKICGSSLNNPEKIKVKENMFGFNEEFDYIICITCGCLQIESLPENIGKYYPENYYSFDKNKSKKGNLKIKFYQLRSMIAQTGLYHVLKLIKHPHLIKLIHYGRIKYDNKILDVGCGSGAMLNDFQDYGFRNLTGIDPFIKQEYKSENLNIYRKNIFEIEGKFDVIIFNHSFEHMREQNSVLERTNELLSECGLLLIRLPVLNYAFEKYREKWVQIDAPRHFFLHSLKSLSLLFEKHGLRTDYIFFDSDEYQFWGSEQCKKGINLTDENSYAVNPRISMFSEKEMAAFRKKASRLNKKRLGDQAAFLLSKVN